MKSDYATPEQQRTEQPDHRHDDAGRAEVVRATPQPELPLIANSLSHGRPFSRRQVISLQRQVGHHRTQQLLMGAPSTVRRRTDTAPAPTTTTDDQQQEDSQPDSAPQTEPAQAAPGADDADGTGAGDGGGSDAQAGDSGAGDKVADDAAAQGGAAAPATNADAGGQGDPAAGAEQNAADTSDGMPGDEATAADGGDVAPIATDPPIAEDATAEIEALIQQGLAAGNGAADIGAQTPEPASSNADSVQRATRDKTEAPVDFTTFLEVVQTRRAELMTQATVLRGQVKTTAASKKADLAAHVVTEQGRLRTAFQAAITQTQTSWINARSDIINQSTAQIQQLQQDEVTQIAELKKRVKAKQADVKKKGEARAKQAKDHGKAESARAQQQTQTNAFNALGIGDAKGRQYASYERANDIRNSAKAMAKKASGEIRKTGPELAKTATSDMRHLAAKFREQARDISGEFDDKVPDIRGKIKDEMRSAVEAIRKLARQSVAKLDETYRRVISKLNEDKQRQVASIGEVGKGLAGQIDETAAALADQVNNQIAGAIVGVEQISQTVLGKFTGTQGEENQATVNEAAAKVASATSSVMATLLTAIVGTGGPLAEKTNAIKTAISGVVTASAEAATRVATEFSQGAAAGQKKAVTGMQDAAKAAKKSATDRVKGVERVLQSAADKADSKWGSALSKGKSELTAKINKGLAKQQTILSKLGPQIDKEAESLENEGWLVRGLRFAWGLVSGLVIELAKALYTVLKVALVVLGVLAAVVLVAVLVSLAGGFMAVLSAVGAVVAFIAAYGALILTVVKIIGVAVGILAALLSVYKLVQAIRNDEFKNDTDRGRQWATAIFDVTSILVPFDDVIAWIKGIKSTRGVSGIGNKVKAMWKSGDAQSVPKWAEGANTVVGVPKTFHGASTKAGEVGDEAHKLKTQQQKK